MKKLYSVVVYWREAGPEMDAWNGEHEEWIVSATSPEEAEQRALEINAFTVRDYEADGWDYEVYECEVTELEGPYSEDDDKWLENEDEWFEYQNWLKTKFECADCGKIEYFPHESEVGKFCNSCWNIQEKMKSLG